METNGPEAKSGSMTNTARPSCAEPAGSSGGSAAARFIGIRKRRWPGCGNFWKTRASIPTIDGGFAIEAQRHRDKKRGGDKEKGGQGDKTFFPFSTCLPFLLISVSLRLCG